MENSAHKSHNFTVKAITTTGTSSNNKKNQVYIPSYHGKFDEKYTESKKSGNTSFQYPYAINGTNGEIGSGMIVWILFEGGDVRCSVIVSNSGRPANSTQYPGLVISNVGGTVDVVSSTNGSRIGASTVMDLAAELIKSHESGSSGYGAINCNDNGALSIGLIQWHGTNAQALMQRIKSNYSTDWNNNNGSKIANLYGNWSNKKLTNGSDEYRAFYAILTSKGGKATQDEMIREYMADYVRLAINKGVTTAPAIVFFCDMAVQTPANAGLVASDAGDKTLDGLYRQVMNNSYWLSTGISNRNRRADSYNTIKKWISNGRFNNLYSDVSDPSKPFIWPVPYKDSWISSGYGYRTLFGETSFHKGIDITMTNATNNDKAIVATASGTVWAINTSCGHNFGKNYNCGCAGGAGNYVTIKHDTGNYVSHYMHMSNVYVSRGEHVVAGQQIGTMGSTGYSTGYHLHFQIMINGDTGMNNQANTVNPENYVGKTS